MSELFFKPWVGSRYTSRSLFGCRLLLLGESHYEQVESYPPDFTSSCVQRFGVEKERHLFFNRVQKTLQGPDAQILDLYTRSTFWNEVAFANFIQEFPGPAHNFRPTTPQWKTGRAALSRLMEMLQPEFIVVLGKGVGHWLPHMSCAHIIIRHPSSRGFSPVAWYPHVRQALNTYLVGK